MSLIPSDSTRELLVQKSRRYQENLAGSHALEYLRDERQISSEALAYFRLGYTGDAPDLGDPSRRISIPYWTPAGPIQIRYRASEDGQKPKYLGTSGATGTVFNAAALSGIDHTVYVTEGEIDAITGWMCGLPTVGIPGSTNWKKTWWRLFRYREVVVLCDGDEAGEKLGAAIRADVENCKVVKMPDNSDVNKFFCDYGRDELRGYVGLDD